MQKRLFFLIFLSSISLRSFSQDEAKTYAFFMIGNYSYPEWEKLEFELRDYKRVIRYSYKKNEKGHVLQTLGTKYIGNQKALIVRIPKYDKTYLILTDKRNSRIIMMSEDQTYKKSFPLGYEGPIDGIGTYCDSCANEPKEAFEIVNSFF
jgi:hypothetical protein